MVDTHEQSRRAILALRKLEEKNSLVLSNLNARLQKKPFGKPDFSLAANFFRTIMSSDIVSVRKNLVIHPKDISVSMEWMRSAESTVVHLSERILKPASLVFQMERKSLYYVERPFPMVWDYDHVEKRMLERAGLKPEYNTDTFNQSLRIGTVMSKVIEMAMRYEGQGAVPIFLPHKQGLFCGYAVLERNTNAYPLRYCKNDFKRSAGKAVIHNKENDKYVPGWSSAAVLVVKTFYPASDLSPKNAALFEKMQLLLNDETFNEQIAKIHESYTTCSDMTLEFDAELLAAIHTVREVTQSDEWNNAMVSRIPKIAHINADPFAQRQP